MAGECARPRLLNIYARRGKHFPSARCKFALEPFFPVTPPPPSATAAGELPVFPGHEDATFRNGFPWPTTPELDFNSH